MMKPDHIYRWPGVDCSPGTDWNLAPQERLLIRDMPEPAARIASDSRWPAFFPVSLSIATTSHAGRTAMERISGASIVNRFPYIMAISVCRKDLSPRHHARHKFMATLEQGGHCALQFPAPGHARDRILETIARISEDQTDCRVTVTGLTTRAAITSNSPVFEDSYLVYEGHLVKPSRDFDGSEILPTPWIDVGSHRLYFLEVTAIQLRTDIADGRQRIKWRGLPTWSNQGKPHTAAATCVTSPVSRGKHYVKGYTPHYEFPSEGTAAFEATNFTNGMAIRMLPTEAADQIETNDDRARWPCFFPSSVGMITSWAHASTPNLMPCGSTTVVSRSPFIIAPCISYARINQRYAPRATLDIIRRTGRFGYGVPFLRDDVVSAIRLTGTRSIVDDPVKVAACGLEVRFGGPSPILPALPVHFDCAVTGEIRMGTHIMFLGEVRRIHLHPDLHAANPISWCPWADVQPHVTPDSGVPTEALAAR